MAKTIKFNLLCDQKPVRKIEDLQNNFVIEDVLTYYKNDLLKRWLSVRGFNEYLRKVEAITSTEDIDIVKDLAKIFEVELDNERLETAVYHMQFIKDRREKLLKLEKAEKGFGDKISEYFMSYHKCVNELAKNSEDIVIIKSILKEMIERYPDIIDLDSRRLFYKFIFNEKLVILCMLMFEEFRKEFLPKEISMTLTDGTVVKELDTKTNFDKLSINNTIKSRLEEFTKLKGVKSFTGQTESYWCDIEPKGKKCLIVSIGNGDYARSSGDMGGDLSYSQINNNFLILDGIDYKSNSTYTSIYYVEV